MVKETIINQEIADYINRIDNFPVDVLDEVIADLRSAATIGVVRFTTMDRIYDAGGNIEDVESLEKETQELAIVVSDLLATIRGNK